jgi:hypothetical protein
MEDMQDAVDMVRYVYDPNPIPVALWFINCLDEYYRFLAYMESKISWSYEPDTIRGTIITYRGLEIRKYFGKAPDYMPEKGIHFELSDGSFRKMERVLEGK